MKIHNNRQPESQGIQQGAQKVTASETKNGSPGAGKVRAADKVEISENGKKVSELMSLMNQIPDIRAEKVKTIQEAIESGKYRPDSLKIAEKMLSEL